MAGHCLQENGSFCLRHSICGTRPEDSSLVRCLGRSIPEKRASCSLFSPQSQMALMPSINGLRKKAAFTPEETKRKSIMETGKPIETVRPLNGTATPDAGEKNGRGGRRRQWEM